MKNSYNLVLKIISFLIIFILIGITSIHAGTLISPVSPSKSMKTLSDLYELVNTGTNTPSTDFDTPTSVSPTMVSIGDTYDLLKTNIQAITTAKVAAGSTIFGVAGKSSVVDTADATADTTKILNTYTAYVNGAKITGNATAGTNYSIPKTGQTSVYITNDDGTYQKGFTGTRFVDNGDNTITDNATGLIWIKDHDAVGTPFDSQMTFVVAITDCEGLTYAGSSVWRVPNRNELLSIVDSSKYGPAIDPLFTNTKSLGYWTSTTYFHSTADAWYVFFGDGGISNYSKGYGFYTRCVR